MAQSFNQAVERVTTLAMELQQIMSKTQELQNAIRQCEQQDYRLQDQYMEGYILSSKALGKEQERLRRRVQKYREQISALENKFIIKKRELFKLRQRYGIQ